MNTKQLVYVLQSGDDFDQWEYHIESILLQKRAMKIIKGTKNRPAEAAARADWDKRDEEALGILKSSLAFSLRAAIQGQTTAKGVYDAIVARFSTKRTIVKGMRVNEFFSLRFNAEESIQCFFNKQDELLLHMQADDDTKITEFIILQQTIGYLPSSFSTVVSVL